MGKKFFTGWDLWQQMTFVLACGIVATVLVGLCKLRYDHYRIRKYSKVEKGKKAATPEMLEAQPEEVKDDIPFGIRAIESGIEVDGVWISRSNTPVGSSASSINEVKLPRSHNSSQLELPQPVHGSSSRNSSRAPSSAFDRAVSAERLPSDSRSSSPGPVNASQARGRPPVASSSRNSSYNLTRNSTTLHALEGLDPNSSSARYEANNAQASPSNSGKSSGRTSDESDYMNIDDARPYEAAYLNPRHASLAVPIDPRMDLDLLQSHRLSHVAETGQLTPRVRRPANSGEWASVAENMRSPQDISTANGVDYFVPRQKTPSPPLAPAISPTEESSIPSASKYNQDGHSSNQARQVVPLLETYQPQAYQAYQPQTYQPRGPQHEYEDEVAQNAVQTTQNQRESHVIRKVNSGFEILRPGTFGPPSPEEEKSEKRQSKRLQKKRRPSESSRTSHFAEHV
ncbi:hypothetical protein K469DRAFT_245556 [Zopfia rhizophila CBS 207.26]|uniref:Uncharacterized protein n=1 Tax=Zopfia rhizophila CBS 207.26 TaxID=1314779 RepID=A0A6A6DV84_9PEZI|nr:hypothetical protein K469DRAFT_245556 [Zopfia rhizophila CBS 207.26]